MNKQSITFSASEQTLEKTGGIDNYASNIVSYVEATFTLGENWTGYDVVRAVWESAYAKISTVLDSDHKCVVPAEVLRHKSKVNVNLVGSIVTNDVLTDRLTTYPVHAITVDADARVDSTETQPITPSQFEQFVEAVHADAESIQDYSYDSEAWAKGTRGGVAVPSTDPTYHNNSKYYADQGAELEQEVSDLKSDFNYNIGMIREGTKNLFSKITFANGNGNTSFALGVFTNVVADTGGTNKSLVIELLDTSSAVEASLTGVGTMVVGTRYSTQFTKTSNSRNIRIKAGGSSKNLYAFFNVSALENGNYVFSFTCEGNVVGSVGGLVLDKFQIEKGTTATAFDDIYTAKDDVARAVANEANSKILPSKNLDGTWELGGIDYSTGAPYSSTSNVRSNYIPVEANKTYAFNIAETQHAYTVYAFLYDSSKTFISRINTDYGYFPKVITIPDNSNIAYIRLNMQTADVDYSDGQAEENTMSTTYRSPTQKALDTSLLPNSAINFKGKKIVVFGDSITAVGDVASTAGSGWTSYFKASVKPSEWHNYAVGGSTWCDYESGDFMSEQIDAFLTDNIADVDCFIISSGTNDINTHNPTDEEIEAQFFDSSMNIISLANVDKTTWAGAMRYAIGKLSGWYPNAKILICTPIHRRYISAEPVRSKPSTILTKNEIIKKMCMRCGVECVDTLQCGISPTDSNANLSGWLTDGLHTKPLGAMMLARYITASYMKAFNIE